MICSADGAIENRQTDRTEGLGAWRGSNEENLQTATNATSNQMSPIR
jgi:hypothetical protein